MSKDISPPIDKEGAQQNSTIAQTAVIVVLPPWCPLPAVFFESWQHEPQWLSQMQWGQREWGLEGRLWPPLEWTNINSVNYTKVIYKTIQWHTALFAFNLSTYIVAFSQKVKCKSIGFCCCERQKWVTREEYIIYILTIHWLKWQCEKDAVFQVQTVNNVPHTVSTRALRLWLESSLSHSLSSLQSNFIPLYRSS